GVFPARLYVTMRHFGLGDNVRVLNGHLRGWVAQGRAVAESNGSGKPNGSATSAVVPRIIRGMVPEGVPGVVVDDNAVRRGVAAGDTTLLDVRPADQFSGEKKGPGVKVAGRIPGAVNVPWQEMVTGVKPPWLRPEAELRATLTAAGVPEPGLNPPGGDTPGVISGKIPGAGAVIVYDAAGMHASLAFMVLAELGYEVSLYDGGYAAWSGLDAEE
ncbi:MAG: rhodanese-like domain-containing protein, partial [Planctomycetota bacterium]